MKVCFRVYALSGFITACLIFSSILELQALEKEVVISVYQGRCRDGDFAANLETVRAAVREALQPGQPFSGVSGNLSFGLRQPGACAPGGSSPG